MEFHRNINEFIIQEELIPNAGSQVITLEKAPELQLKIHKKVRYIYIYMSKGADPKRGVANYNPRKDPRNQN